MYRVKEKHLGLVNLHFQGKKHLLTSDISQDVLAKMAKDKVASAFIEEVAATEVVEEETTDVVEIAAEDVQTKPSKPKRS